MIKQKDAVYSTVKNVLADSGITHEDGQSVQLSKAQRDICVGMLVSGFEAGKIELESKQDNLKSYAGGLLNNWLRKDKRFNGGVKYQPTNPGSRTGQTDPMVKNLRILASTLPVGSDAHTAVTAKIEARVTELKSEKNAGKAKEIDFSFIPDEIKDLLNN